MKNVVVVTNMPSYHQVDLFNAVAQLQEINLHVCYLRKLTPGRQWKTLRNMVHSYTFIKEYRIHPHFYLNRGLFRELKKFNPDLIIMTQYASISMQIMMYYASFFKIPWIFWSERPGVEWTELPIFKSELLRKMFRYIALIPIKYYPKEIWGIGERAQKYFSELTKRPCRNMPYFADYSKFLKIERNKPRNPIRFLYSGKFIYRKGVDILLEAIEFLLNKKMSFEFVFIGDGPLRKQLVDLSDKYPFNVKYLGFKEIDDVASIFAECDILVCPSRYDGWGMVVTEGMAAGMPVVSTAQTGSAVDMIVDGQNGYLMQRLDKEQLVFYMQRFIEKPEIIRKMGEKARETASFYNHRIGARTFLDMIHNVTDNLNFSKGRK